MQLDNEVWAQLVLSTLLKLENRSADFGDDVEFNKDGESEFTASEVLECFTEALRQVAKSQGKSFTQE